MPAQVLDYSDVSIRLAARVIQEGGVIAFATDTVYGLGCDPRNADAVEKLFRLKRRDAKPVPILCDAMKTAGAIAELGQLGESLAIKYWPGALTIVAPIRISLPFPVHQGSGMVGVRVPNSDRCRALLAACGGMLTGTSANLSGEPPCRSATDALSNFGAEIDLIVDGGYLGGKESTVVRLTTKGIEVLREGSIKVEQNRR